jgi:PAS domain S-box-containing protein
MNTSHPTTDTRPSSPATAARETPVSSPVGWLLFALVFMLGLLAYLAYASYRQAEDVAATSTRNLVQALESRLSSDLAQTRDVLEFLARRVSEAELRPTLSVKEQPAIAGQLADLEKSFPDAGALNLFDAEGTLRHASDPKLKGISIADRPHFRVLRDDPAVQIAFSDAQIARTSGKWSIVMARALRDERGRFLGTVNAVVTLDSISKLFQSIDVGPGGLTLLRRSDTSKLIERIPRNNEKDFNQPLPLNNPIRQRIDAGERAGTLSLIASTDGVERLASFKVLESAPFYVQVALAKDHYLAGWKRGVIGVAGLAALLLIGFGFIVWHLRRSEVVAKEAARQLAYREALFGGLFEQSGFLAGILDQSGRLLEVNPSALAVIGLRREEVIGQNFADAPWWSRDEDRAALEAALQAAAAGAAGSFEAVHSHTGGGEITVQFHAVPVQAGGERYIAVTGIDITKRIRAENSLREGEAFVQGVLNSLASQIAVIDNAGTIVAINQAWQQFSLENSPEPGQVTPNTDIGTNYLAMSRADVSPGSDEALCAHDGILAVLTGRLPAFSLEYPCHSPQEQRWFRLNVTPLLNSGSRGAVVVRDNITTSKLAKIALAESEDNFRTFYNSIQDFLFVLDLQGNILFFNDYVRARLDYTAEELCGQSVLMVHPEARREEAMRIVTEMLAGAANHCPVPLQAKDGQLIPVETRVVRGHWNGQPALFGLSHDITERVEAEQRLTNEQQRLSNILWGTGAGTWEWNVQTGETRFNERWAEIVGYRLEELAPVNIDTWMRLAHPDDLGQSGELLARHFSGETDHYECEARMRHKDGHWVWVLDRGKVVSRTPDGQPEWMAGTHSDISERKQAEHALHQKTDALARSNAELEQFAYVASHDLRQPLRMVNSYVQLLERRLTDTLDDEAREMMHFATDGAKRLDQMLVSLLEYSRVGRKGEPLAPLASRSGVDEALRFLVPAINEANATVRVSGDWPEVVASRDEFTRLWQNLIGNAVKYRAPERNPEIDITVTPEADGWRFCVTDNGIGIAPAQFDRLFKVFQRLHTRDQYEGSGIGLAVARKIVERHGGRIWVESAGDGQGCRFCFFLSGDTHEDS